MEDRRPAFFGALASSYLLVVGLEMQPILILSDIIVSIGFMYVLITSIEFTAFPSKYINLGQYTHS